MADVSTGVAAGTGAYAKTDAKADKLADVRAEDMARLLGMMKATGRNSYEYLSRLLVRVCPVCGEVFETSGRGRPRRFCSAACRRKYHHGHPKPENWKSTRVAVCPVCGKPMTMNLRSDNRFAEDEGWHEASERYTDRKSVV